MTEQVLMKAANGGVLTKEEKNILVDESLRLSFEDLNIWSSLRRNDLKFVTENIAMDKKHIADMITIKKQLNGL